MKTKREDANAEQKTFDGLFVDLTDLEAKLQKA